MINIKINGENLELESDATILEFLISMGYNKDRVAIERDGEILKKSLWDSEKISSGKSYEIVEFVGGG